MQRYAFKMLSIRARDEYRRRHDGSAELVHLLRQAGVSNYSIWLDEETHILFGYLERRDDHGMDALPQHPVMQRKWWQHMKDVMRANPDGSPVAIALEEMFSLA